MKAPQKMLDTPPNQEQTGKYPTNSPSNSQVVSLDPPNTSRTKSQIESMVDEILAATHQTNLGEFEFFNLMMVRLVAALGAIGGALWRKTSEDGCWELLHNDRLPAQFFDCTDHSNPPHESETTPEQRIGEISNYIQDIVNEANCADKPSADERPSSCASFKSNVRPATFDRHHQPQAFNRDLLNRIAGEGVAVLVPPTMDGLESNQTPNPTEFSLIFSPIRQHQKSNEIWIQIAQPPSGGVVAQRGYLRFVSQIADIASEFLARNQLQRLESEQRFQRLSNELLQLLAKPSPLNRTTSEPNHFVLICRQVLAMLRADDLLITYRDSKKKLWTIDAPGSLSKINNRGSSARLLSSLIDSMIVNSSALPQSLDCPSWIRMPDRRRESRIQTESPTCESTESKLGDADLIKGLQAEFNLAQFLWIPLIECHSLESTGVGCLILWNWSSCIDSNPYFDEKSKQEKANSLQAILRISLKQSFGKNSATPLAQQDSKLANVIQKHTGRTNRWQTFRRIFRNKATQVVFMAAIVSVICAIPVPNRFQANAILKAVEEQRLFAPVEGKVQKLWVDFGDQVDTGQPILEIDSPQLRLAFEEASTSLAKSIQRQAELQNRLLRSTNLPAEMRVELEGELQVLGAVIPKEQARVDLLEDQLQSLIVTAPLKGTIGTWNLRSNTQDRPVQAGQLLANIYNPDGAWVLYTSIEERDTQKFLEAQRTNTLDVTAYLNGYPNQPIQAVVREVNLTSIAFSQSPNSSQRNLLVELAIPRNAVPRNLDGSPARVDFRWGETPLANALFGDLLQQLWNRIRIWI